MGPSSKTKKSKNPATLPIVVGTLLRINAGSMFIRSSSGVGNKLIANAAYKIVVIIDAAVVFTSFGSSKKFVPWLFPESAGIGCVPAMPPMFATNRISATSATTSTLVSSNK